MSPSPVSAIGTTTIELFGPAAGHSKWGVALWGVGTWAELTWRDVTPESMNVTTAWGAATPAGVLSVPEASGFTVRTYDPDRILDPSNPDSIYVSVLRTGTPFRVSYLGSVTRRVRTGTLDEITYNIDDATGMLRAYDGVSLAAGAKVPAGTTGAPTKLRARARWLITRHNLPITVEADPGTGDPDIGGNIAEEASVWDWIMTAAMDCLNAVWMDGSNTLKFRSYGSPNNLGLVLGDGGIAMDDLQLQASAVGVYSKVIAYDDGAPSTPITVTSQGAINKYGKDVTYERTRPVPDGAGWASAVRDDREDAGLQYLPQRLRPVTDAELLSLLDTGMVDVARIVVSSRQEGRVPVVPTIDVDARVLGGAFEANTATGWSAQIVSYISAAEWEAL